MNLFNSLMAAGHWYPDFELVSVHLGIIGLLTLPKSHISI